MVPEVDADEQHPAEKCTYSGRCAEVCQYHAIAMVGDRGVDEYCEAEGIPILMRVPLDRRIAGFKIES